MELQWQTISVRAIFSTFTVVVFLKKTFLSAKIMSLYVKIYSVKKIINDETLKNLSFILDPQIVYIKK